MDQDNQKFIQLIEAAMAVSREGCELAKTQDDYQELGELVRTKQVRLELRIRFNPLPSVACEVIRDCDGELVGIMFELQAHQAAVN